MVFHIIVFGHYIHSESRRGKRRCAIGTPILQGIFCTPYPCDSARMPKSQGRMPSGARRKDGPRDSLLLAMGVGFSYQLGLDEAPQNNKGGEEREGENSPGRWGRGGASEQGRGFVWKLGFLVFAEIRKGKRRYFFSNALWIQVACSSPLSRSLEQRACCMYSLSHALSCAVCQPLMSLV